MHDDLKIKYTKPITKFLHKLINFEKPPKNSSKTQNLGQKKVKCMINE